MGKFRDHTEFRSRIVHFRTEFSEGEASHEASHGHIKVNLGNRNSQTVGGSSQSVINHGQRFQGGSIEEVLR